VNTILSVNHQRVASISFEDFQIYPGAGVHRGALPVRLLPADGLVGTLVDATCVVYAKWPTREGSARRWLCEARFEAPAQLAAFETPETFYFQLTDEQINFIEDQSGGNDLQLDIQLRARVIYQDGKQFSVYVPETMLMVRREEWLRQLGNLPRASWATVGLVTSGQPGALGSIAQHLRDATRLMDGREYPSAATAVRKALEVIRTTFVPAQAPREADIVVIRPKENRPYEYRLLMIFYSALSLSNLAPHADSEAARFVWTRQAVESLFAMTSTIAAQIATGAWPTMFPPVPQPQTLAPV
jgi:hypothetical protein